jgi:hypothetical protein
MLLVVGVCHADDPAPNDIVSYFRVETVEPLRLFFEYSLLGRLCSHRYTRLCPVRPESEKAFEEAVAAFRVMTGDMLNDLRSPSHLGSFKDTALQMGTLKDQLENAMPEHERRLYARIEALNRVCPDAKGQKRQDVIELNIDANFTRFWRQPSPIYQRTVESFHEEASAFEEMIRTEWPIERCAATLDVARDVLSEMISKNLPFVTDASHSLPSNELVGASGEQFLGISYVLEAMLHPEMQSKFAPKALRPLQH